MANCQEIRSTDPSNSQNNGGGKGKSVTVLLPRDVTVSKKTGEVLMPNTIEMAQIKKAGKGRFKTGIQFSSKMSERDVRKKLQDEFNILKNQRFCCASVIDNRTKLNFHGKQRVWDGDFIKRNIRGNSALYILIQLEETNTSGSTRKSGEQHRQPIPGPCNQKIIPPGAASVAVSRPFNEELVPNATSHLKMASRKRKIGSETAQQESSSQQNHSGLAKKRNIEQKQKKSSSTTITPNSSSADLQQTENQLLKKCQTLEDDTAKSGMFSWQTSGVPKGLLETTPLLGTTVGSSQQVQHCNKSVTQNIQRQVCSQGFQQSLSKPITTIMMPPFCMQSDLPVSTATVTQGGPPQQYCSVAGVHMVEHETTDPYKSVHLTKQQQSRTVQTVSLESVSHCSKHDQETAATQESRISGATSLKNLKQVSVTTATYTQPNMPSTCGLPVELSSNIKVQPLSDTGLSVLRLHTISSSAATQENAQNSEPENSLQLALPAPAPAAHKNVPVQVFKQDTSSNERKGKDSPQKNPVFELLLAISEGETEDSATESMWEESTNLDHSTGQSGGILTEISPNKGSIKGGDRFHLILADFVPVELEPFKAIFHGCGDVYVEKASLCTLAGKTPGSQRGPGKVRVALMSSDGSWLGGECDFLYTEDPPTEDEILSNIVKDRGMWDKLFDKMRSSKPSDGQTSDSSGKTVPGSSSLHQSSYAWSVELLKLLVYKAAEIDGQEFIQIIFSTSAGKVIFNSYRNSATLPEDVARTNGHLTLANYLQDVNSRLSKEGNSDAGTESIDWLELKHAMDEEQSLTSGTDKTQIVKKCQALGYPESDDDERDYFADDEISSSSSPSHNNASDSEKKSSCEEEVNEEDSLPVESNDSSELPLHLGGNQLEVIPSMKAENAGYKHKQQASDNVESHSIGDGITEKEDESTVLCRGEVENWDTLESEVISAIEESSTGTTSSCIATPDVVITNSSESRFDEVLKKVRIITTRRASQTLTDHALQKHAGGSTERLPKDRPCKRREPTIRSSVLGLTKLKLTDLADELEDQKGNLIHIAGIHNQHLSIAKDLEDRAREGRGYGNLGNVYQSLGDFKQAVEYHTQHLSIAKELGNRAGEGHAYGNLGNAYQSLGDFKQAVKYHNQHLSIAKELGNRPGEGHACYSLGLDFELSGNLQVALDYYRLSVNLFNDTRFLLQSEDDWKISFRNSYHVAYTGLWRTLLRLQKTDEALCVVEQGRARALEDLIKFRHDSELLTIGPLEDNVTIASLSSGIFMQTLFLALESTKIHFWVLNKESEVQYRSKEIEGEDVVTFLECVRKDIFKENSIDRRVICENRSLEELRNERSPSKEFVEETGKPSAHSNNSLRFFHDHIIAPIADLLEGDALIIVPEGPLCLAPYAAFLGDKFKYLTESIRIRILPTLTTLKLIGNFPQDYHRSSGVLLVGDPCVNEITNEQGEVVLSPLPYAREEVNAIGEMLGVVPLTGNKATKEEVLKRIGSVALVHIAAHGNMETGEIALAPNPARISKIPEEKDFLLKMADVHAAKLRASLVVLSCCHSAQGNVTAEGVVGIARAFLGAGARSVLLSLWAIDDVTTMEFMKAFYKDLSLGCSASVALQRAMKCLRESEKFGAVKHWAPFVLIGDDVTIEFEGSQGKHHTERSRTEKPP